MSMRADPLEVRFSTNRFLCAADDDDDDDDDYNDDKDIVI